MKNNRLFWIIVICANLYISKILDLKIVQKKRQGASRIALAIVVV